MDIGTYQREITVFAKYPITKAAQYCLLGLIGEAGELANQVKKIIRDDNGVVTPERTDKLILEAGDVLWYATRLATHDEFDLAEYEPFIDRIAETTLISATFEVNRVVNTLADQQCDVSDVIDALATFAHVLGTDLDDLARLNFQKLEGRLERGTLGGSGDDR